MIHNRTFVRRPPARTESCRSRRARDDGHRSSRVVSARIRVSHSYANAGHAHPHHVRGVVEGPYISRNGVVNRAARASRRALRESGTRSHPRNCIGPVSWSPRWSAAPSSPVVVSFPKGGLLDRTPLRRIRRTPPTSAGRGFLASDMSALLTGRR